MRKIIIITGPTGVGKTDFAEKLAASLDGEIINADQGQFYTPLTIGTAKPDWKKSAIKQHLFDVVTEPQNYSNSAYQKAAQKIMNEIENRGKRVIVVGGSGFYYQMFLFRYTPFDQHNALIVPPEDYPRTWQHLSEIDPVRAEQLHQNDAYRIQRALEIFYSSGALPSSLGLHYAPLRPYQVIHVTRDTDDLYERINQRTDLMMRDGWLKETQGLPQEWKDFVRVKKPIGYDLILHYLDHQITYEMLISAIQQRTRNYAKRQKTFFRSLLKKIPLCDSDNFFEVNLTLSPVDLYLNQLITSLSQMD